jgi:hypothetical protein
MEVHPGSDPGKFRARDLLYTTRRRPFSNRLPDCVSSPETVFFDRIWRLINLLGWMFRVLARNMHPNVVILGPVSDAEVADPDARGCLPTNTRVDKRRPRIARHPLWHGKSFAITATVLPRGRGRGGCPQRTPTRSEGQYYAASITTEPLHPNTTRGLRGAHAAPALRMRSWPSLRSPRSVRPPFACARVARCARCARSCVPPAQHDGR